MRSARAAPQSAAPRARAVALALRTPGGPGAAPRATAPLRRRRPGTTLGCCRRRPRRRWQAPRPPRCSAQQAVPAAAQAACPCRRHTLPAFHPPGPPPPRSPRRRPQPHAPRPRRGRPRPAGQPARPPAPPQTAPRREHRRPHPSARTPQSRAAPALRPTHGPRARPRGVRRARSRTWQRQWRRPAGRRRFWSGGVCVVGARGAQSVPKPLPGISAEPPLSRRARPCPAPWPPPRPTPSHPVPPQPTRPRPALRPRPEGLFSLRRPLPLRAHHVTRSAIHARFVEPGPQGLKAAAAADVEHEQRALGVPVEFIAHLAAAGARAAQGTGCRVGCQHVIRVGCQHVIGVAAASPRKPCYMDRLQKPCALVGPPPLPPRTRTP
jgi:hypothetical protein